MRAAAFLLFFSTMLLGQIDVSAFMDIIQGKDLKNGSDLGLNLGQCEIGFASTAEGPASAEAAFALNPESGGIELGAALISHELAAGEDWSLNVDGGQFDVPFGLDYQFLPSPDRLLITSPLAVELSTASWNTVGADLSFYSSRLDAALLLLNGIAVEKSLAARMDLRIIPALSAGASWFSDLNDSEDAVSSFGVHGSLTLPFFNAAGEFISSRNLYEGLAADSSTHAFYLQLSRDLLPSDDQGLTLVAQVSMLSLNEGPYAERWTLGLNWAVNRHFIMKTEYNLNRSDSESGGSDLQLQAVAYF